MSDTVSSTNTLHSRSDFSMPCCPNLKEVCTDLAIMVSSVGLAVLAGYAIASAIAYPIGIAIGIAVAVGVLAGTVACIAYHILNARPQGGEEKVLLGEDEAEQFLKQVQNQNKLSKKGNSPKLDDSEVKLPEVKLNSLRNIPPVAMFEELAEVVENAPKFNGYRLLLSAENPSFQKGLENLVMTGMSIRPSNLFFQAALGSLVEDEKDVTTMPGSHKLFAFTLSHDKIADFIKEKSETDEVVTFSAIDKAGKAKVTNTFDVQLEDIYGDNQYSISYQEIQAILDSQKIYVSSLLPIQFYRGLKDAMEEDGVIELAYNRKNGIQRPAHFSDWKNEKSVVAFLEEVRMSPQNYGFKDAEAFNELMKLTVYQIGAMVVNSEDWHIFVDGDGEILEREVGTEDAVRLLNACGIRPEEKTTSSLQKKIIMTETFKTALAAAESGIVLFPAVGMGVWGGNPDVYWTAFLDAVVASEQSFEAIFVNPNHRPYKGDNTKAGQEFETYLQAYIAKYVDGPYANDASLQKLLRIQNLQAKQTDLVQLARELKMAFPDTIISLFNASDPDVTFGNHVGEYTNNMPHTTTTEENYTAIGTNGLCFKSITKVHEDPDRLFQVDYVYSVMNDVNISEPVKDLFHLLFVDSIRPNNIEEVQPLGSQLEAIGGRLMEFNREHYFGGIVLGCRGSQHSDDLNDPWQTIKITDPFISEEGKISPVLQELNDVLFNKFGILSNGGDEGAQGVERGKQKRTPQCFVNSKDEVMNPQLLISLMDIKRILGLIDEEAYFQALKNPQPNVVSQGK